MPIIGIAQPPTRWRTVKRHIGTALKRVGLRRLGLRVGGYTCVQDYLDDGFIQLGAMRDVD